MKLRKLITTKPHKYGTRHLTAGEEYEVPPRHAIALVAGKKARFADDKPMRATKPAPRPQVIEPQSDPEPQPPEPHAVPAMHTNSVLERLHAEAEQIGLVVDRRWGVARLQYEIEQAKR